MSLFYTSVQLKFKVCFLSIRSILKVFKLFKSVSLYCQVAAWVPDMFCNFYNVKKLIFAITQQPWKLKKNKHGFGILRNWVIFWMHVSLNLKTIKCYFVKLATNLYWQPSFWFHLINQGGFKANFLMEKCLKIIKRHCHWFLL